MEPTIVSALIGAVVSVTIFALTQFASLIGMKKDIEWIKITLNNHITREETK
jgi:hypothetical protein